MLESGSAKITMRRAKMLGLIKKLWPFGKKKQENSIKADLDQMHQITLMYLSMMDRAMQKKRMTRQQRKQKWNDLIKRGLVDRGIFKGMVSIAVEDRKPKKDDSKSDGKAKRGRAKQKRN